MWLLSHNNIFSLSLLIVFISPPHLAISLCLQGGHLDCLNACRKLQFQEGNKRKLPLIPGTMAIFLCRPSTVREKPAPCRYIELKDFQIEKSFRSVMHLTKGMEFCVGYYCCRAQPPSNQQHNGWRKAKVRQAPPPQYGPMAW